MLASARVLPAHRPPDLGIGLSTALCPWWDMGVRPMSNQLSPETNASVRDHLKKHWKEPRLCPICESTNWHIQPGELIRPIAEFSRNETPMFIPGDGTIPTVQIMCDTCFYVHTFLLMPIIQGEG